MRILHIVESFAGGVITYLRTLVNGMSEEHQAYILYALRPQTPSEPEKLFRPGTVLIQSEHLAREISLPSDFAAFREIRRQVRELRPDVVHLHSSKAGALGRWAIDGRKQPLFYTPHGYSFLMESTGMKKNLYFLTEKLCGARCCNTVACGEGEFAQSRLVTSQATYINSGIDRDELDGLCPNAAARAGGPSVCTLARITYQKNPELFNRIARALPDVKFVWIGDGDMRGALDSPNIEITGWLPREQALAKMMESSIFLLPSLWEGLSISMLEAMYLRRACVVSRIPANTGAVRHGETGYCADALEDYVRILRDLLENGADARVLDAARSLVARDYSKENMVRKYEQIYREGVSKRQGAHS